MDLKDMRKNIDKIDEQFIKLFSERMDTSLEVAKFKEENNLEILQSDREQEILDKITKGLKSEMVPYATSFYKYIFHLSKTYQTSNVNRKNTLADEIKKAAANTRSQLPENVFVACQGADGSYSQIASEKAFSNSSILYFRTWEDVINAVEKGMCTYGVLPLENSIHGSVNKVYDLIKEHRFYIVQTVKQPIKHSLLVKSPISSNDIKEVYSHEQALGQCSQFLLAHPHIKVNVVENTAVAARMVSESNRKDIAAIASPTCAEIYNLCNINDNIQNNENNFTRFICICKNMEIYSGAEKTSLMASLAHQPGSLNRFLSLFALEGINMSKLESRPIPGKDFEFMFYVDLEAGIFDEKLYNILTRITPDIAEITFLGSYKEI